MLTRFVSWEAAVRAICFRIFMAVLFYALFSTGETIGCN